MIPLFARKISARSCPGSASVRLVLVISVLLVVFVGLGWMVRRPHSPSRQASVASTVGQPPTPIVAESPKSPFGIPPAPLPPAAKVAPAATPGPNAERLRTFDSFQRRPFAATKSSGTNEWTSEDAMSPAVIRQIAHNELEAQRLTEENARIKRRQLVYRKETVPALLDRARNSGQSLQTFTLPAMDGRELSVLVTDTHVDNTQNFGTVSGRLQDHLNSMVSVGFSNGHESFNVASPEEGLYLVGDAREPGEVILKEFDPDKYAPPSAHDEPDFVLTGQTSPQPPKN